MKTPLLFEMNGRRALVVGLGRVGRRRARTLADAGCAVTALIQVPPPADWDSTGVKMVQKTFEAADLASADLAVAATDDAETNAAVLAACRTRGIPVNVADNPGASDFFFPSVIRRGDLTLSVCTEGASPMTTKAIVKELKAAYGEDYAERLVYLKTLRAVIIAGTDDAAEKRRRLKELTALPTSKLAALAASQKQSEQSEET
ncbi:bifunctional precorrin-2 dehydrogenase/sirohydrochlorin ferrochelatase [Pseudoramibacter faecis]|uniref:precorrin-2 dehydrogenase/sirohydrochlorin ferrochelatase family protein n=1 Tax=Pseudoramibacter faecis TaxID=3108534 RepID=UPI002E75B0F2|nr:bifunctional precorrin-2 dehydrogenase/sirohydrochlorin ferrochelatase [Pseudoramibacter sp. HA2172]